MIVNVKVNDALKRNVKRVSLSGNIHNVMRASLRRFAKPFLRWLRDNMAYQTGTASKATVQSISMDRSRYWVRFHPRPIRKERKRGKGKLRGFGESVAWYWYKAVSYYGVREELEDLWEKKGNIEFSRWLRGVIKEWGNRIAERGFGVIRGVPVKEALLPNRPGREEYRNDRFRIVIKKQGRRVKLEKYLEGKTIKQRQRFLYRIRKRVLAARETLNRGGKVKRIIEIKIK